MGLECVCTQRRGGVNQNLSVFFFFFLYKKEKKKKKKKIKPTPGQWVGLAQHASGALDVGTLSALSAVGIELSVERDARHALAAEADELRAKLAATERDLAAARAVAEERRACIDKIMAERMDDGSFLAGAGGAAGSAQARAPDAELLVAWPIRVFFFFFF
jgi:hypothetical protein